MVSAGQGIGQAPASPLRLRRRPERTDYGKSLLTYNRSQPRREGRVRREARDRVKPVGAVAPSMAHGYGDRWECVRNNCFGEQV